MKHTLISGLLASSLLLTPSLQAADYKIDTEGAHASINFRISHLGTSWLTGRFNKFDGQFSYDESNLAKSSVTVEIDTASIDSNHAERDKHLRDKRFLDVKRYPTAKFVSTEFVPAEEGNAKLHGNLTLHGVTRSLVIELQKVGEGKDPWGGYRAGFSGTTSFKLKDFDITYDLGPMSETIYLDLEVEGIRQ